MSDTKPRRFVRLFKPQFASMVEAGTKRQTIRPTPKRMPKPGDILDARTWTGKPYRSKQRKLGEFTITGVFGSTIDNFRADVGRLRDGLNRLARLDGFKDWPEMLAWFEHEHGLPFTGIIIYWASKK